MDRLSDHTRLLLRRENLTMALRTASENIVLQSSTAPARLIAGIALSGGAKNANGDAIAAGGLRYSLPLPLLYAHNNCAIVGRVTALRIESDALHFRAEVCNGPHALRMPVVDSVWNALCAGQLYSVSIGWCDAVRNASGMVESALLDEISLVDNGADRNARVTKVWQRDGVMRLAAGGIYERAETVFWSEGA